MQRLPGIINIYYVLDNNDTLEKVKLSFSTTSQLPAHEHLAFVIQTVDGKQYLIGTADKPFPVIKAWIL